MKHSPELEVQIGETAAMQYRKIIAENRPLKQAHAITDRIERWPQRWRITVERLPEDRPLTKEF